MKDNVGFGETKAHIQAFSEQTPVSAFDDRTSDNHLPKLPSRRTISSPKEIGRAMSARLIFRPMAPEAGFEPATSKLTASCSTAELLRNTELFYLLRAN